MAIAFDAQANSGAIENFNTGGSYSITIGSGSNRYLMVWLYYFFNPPTSATFDGNAMTVVKTEPPALGYSGCRVYQVINPGTGSKTILFTFPSDDYWASGALSYSGVAQTSPVDADVSSIESSVSSPYTLTLTTTTPDCWLVGGMAINNTSSRSAGTNTTLRQNFGSNQGNTIDSGAARSAGSNSLQMTYTSSPGSRSGIVIAIKPAVTTPTVSQVMQHHMQIAGGLM